jgi:natural product biosynthesis luciferase-like monooxygenase protein
MKVLRAKDIQFAGSRPPGAAAMTGPAFKSIHEMFERQAEQTPNALALVSAEQELTYDELNGRVNRLAHYLRKRGVRPGARVGVCIEQSPDLITGLLATLKAGGACVLLDPALTGEQASLIASQAGASVILTRQHLAGSFKPLPAQVVCLDSDREHVARESEVNPPVAAAPDAPAYLICAGRSGSPDETSLVTQENLAASLEVMDGQLGREAGGLLVLDHMDGGRVFKGWLWVLTRGGYLVFPSGADAGEALRWLRGRRRAGREVEFSLLYFDGKGGATGPDKYELLIEGTKFADTHGFAAVWTPERHFHEFGGMYPNPSVTSAALAMITERIQLRAGSVVAPLHHALRVAEEWAVVDNLSRGRVGISFAAGWHADDFAFAPGNYAGRKEAMIRGVEEVRRLWRGEAVGALNGAGKSVELRTFPRPVQPEVPVWVTCSGNPETFALAGELGANVLTHLLGQSIEELREKVELYRASLARHGHDPETGRVTLMMHTFLGEDVEAVRATVSKPFCNYLASSISLIQRQLGNPATAGANAVPWRKSASAAAERTTTNAAPVALSDGEKEELVAYGFKHYFDTAALFGTPETCLELVGELRAIGVDEIACLIDFGVETGAALESLSQLHLLKEHFRSEPGLRRSPLCIAPDVSMLQCDAATLSSLSSEPLAKSWSSQLQVLLLTEDQTAHGDGSRIKNGATGQAFQLPPPLCEEIIELSCREDVMLCETLLAAFQILLHRHTGEEEVGVVACLSPLRRDGAGDLTRQSVNTVLARNLMIGGPDFRAVLQSAGAWAAEASACRELSFEQLSAERRAEQEFNASSTLRAMFIFLDEHPPDASPVDQSAAILEGDDKAAEYDLVLTMWRGVDDLRGLFSYDAGQFEADAITRMQLNFQTLLENIASDPSQPVSRIPIISEEENLLLSQSFNSPF